MKNLFSDVEQRGSAREYATRLLRDGLDGVLHDLLIRNGVELGAVRDVRQGALENFVDRPKRQ